MRSRASSNRLRLHATALLIAGSTVNCSLIVAGDLTSGHALVAVPDGNDSEARASDSGASEAGPSEAGAADSGPTDGLVAHWAFDEGSGTVAHDDAGGDDALTIVGGTWTPGKKGQALHFDGTNAYATTSSLPALGSTHTLALWVRLDAATAKEMRFLNVAPGTLTLRVDPMDRWSFSWNTAPAATDVITSSGAPAEAQAWHHLASTHDGTTARLYVDGAEVARKTSASKSYGVLRVDVGGDSTDSVAFAAATIDDVRIYDRALSASEIIELL